MNTLQLKDREIKIIDKIEVILKQLKDSNIQKKDIINLHCLLEDLLKEYSQIRTEYDKTVIRSCKK